jgi:hypothetical protein
MESGAVAELPAVPFLTSRRFQRPEVFASAQASDALTTTPPAGAGQRRNARLPGGQPVGDVSPDHGARVFLEEVACVGDHVADLRAQRSREAVTGVERDHGV